MTSPADVAPLELSEVRPTKKESAATPLRDLSVIGQVQVKLEAVIGHCQLPVARLLSLSAGDVLNLSAGLDDPITLRLNEQTIARGELVAVGDQFGVRITEVL